MDDGTLQRRAIRKAIARYLGISVDKILNTAEFAELGVEGDKRVDLFSTIEQAFSIVITESEAQCLNYLAQLYDLVAEKTSKEPV